MAQAPQVVDAVKIPVVAAGGIGDARGIVAAFALGAQGVQMGTVFLACEESVANTHHRNALLSGQAKQTALTPKTLRRANPTAYPTKLALNVTPVRKNIIITIVWTV